MRFWTHTMSYKSRETGNVFECQVSASRHSVKTWIVDSVMFGTFYVSATDSTNAVWAFVRNHLPEKFTAVSITEN